MIGTAGRAPGHHPPRREDDQRRLRGDRAEDLGDRAQGLRRRALRDGRARPSSPTRCLALPTASIAVMGPQAAVNAVFYNQLQAIEDPDERARDDRGAAPRVRRGHRHPAPRVASSSSTPSSSPRTCARELVAPLRAGRRQAPRVAAQAQPGHAGLSRVGPGAQRAGPASTMRRSAAAWAASAAWAPGRARPRTRARARGRARCPRACRRCPARPTACGPRPARSRAGPRPGPRRGARPPPRRRRRCGPRPDRCPGPRSPGWRPAARRRSPSAAA